MTRFECRADCLLHLQQVDLSPNPMGSGFFLGAVFESFDLMYFRTEVTSCAKRSQEPGTQAQL